MRPIRKYLPSRRRTLLSHWLRLRGRQSRDQLPSLTADATAQVDHRRAAMQHALRVVNSAPTGVRRPFGQGTDGLVNALVQHKNAMDAAALVCELDLDGRIIYVNDLFVESTGHARQELMGVRLEDLSEHPAGRDGWVPGKEIWRGELAMHDRTGDIGWRTRTIVPIFRPDDSIEKYICIDIDITHQKQVEETLQLHATHDPLTGLPNRVLLEDRLKQAMAQAARTGSMVGVLFIDLDQFKYVNDGYGHAVGDALLQAVASRLTSNLRSGDTVARLGGDEFVIVLPNVLRGRADVSTTAAKLLEAFAQPLQAGPHEFTVTASIGISIYPESGRTLNELLMNADAAMYRAKESGRNNCQFYAPEMHARAVERLSMESALRRAVELEQLELHYQPQVDLSTGEVVGMEALVRWRHPNLGLLPPQRFIPLAEETGLIMPIGEWVLRTACLQAKAWQEAGLAPLRVSVNLSARQLRQMHFATVVRRVLDATGLGPEYLDLELTETMVIGETIAMIKRLNEFRELGVRLSIDDFGTGYSSLAYLKTFPLEQLKIDQSFVRDLPHSNEAAGIAKAIVTMARGLRLKTIAEGVEKVEQAEFLKSIDCEYAQGFLYSRPLPAAEFAAFIREQAIARLADATPSPVVRTVRAGRALKSVAGK